MQTFTPNISNADVFCKQIADQAVFALLAELSTWPKPGLVSYVDNGSHQDMDAGLLAASANCLHPFFVELVEAGQRNAGMDELRGIGIRAEKQMLTVTEGVNTHRGAIFGLGLLCAAAGLNSRFPDEQASLGQRVAQRWGSAIIEGPLPSLSHGIQALHRYGAGGARSEAASGFPSIYQLGLPALQEGLRLRPYEYGAASVHTCMALIAKVEDTNLLHRGGREGALFAVQCANGFIASGGIALEDWEARATAIHREFVARNLSPGGCADLLAMTLFVAMVEDREYQHD